MAEETQIPKPTAIIIEWTGDNLKYIADKVFLNTGRNEVAAADWERLRWMVADIIVEPSKLTESQRKEGRIIEHFATVEPPKGKDTKSTIKDAKSLKDLDYAERAYGSFASHLLRSTTTRAAIFATIHVPATELLMQKLDAMGLECFVGKVNMNRNSPVYLREISTNQALRDTERWICETKARYAHVRPILTPRFIPSCTDDLMFGLARLRVKYDLPVQSHLSENYSEIAWIRELCPRSKNYGDAYEQFGMFGGGYPCIMAHCVHSNEDEQALMQKNGVFIAHSPESNMNLASGVAPINKFLDNGLQVGLATDVAGGSHESMLRAMTHAIQASKLRWRLYDQDVKPLSFDRAFYLATMGGGAFFGKVGSFLDGYEFDAVVLDDAALDHPQELSVRARLERAAYLADDRNLTAKFVAGQKILG